MSQSSQLAGKSLIRNVQIAREKMVQSKINSKFLPRLFEDVKKEQLRKMLRSSLIEKDGAIDSKMKTPQYVLQDKINGSYTTPQMVPDNE